MATQRRVQQPVGEQPLDNNNTTNVSLPDISSTEIAPNKLAVSSKIININHVRGLQYYQKQLSKVAPKNNNEMLIDELGGRPKVSVLRNRSTSPTIIPKKMVKKDPL